MPAEVQKMAGPTMGSSERGRESADPLGNPWPLVAETEPAALAMWRFLERVVESEEPSEALRECLFGLWEMLQGLGVMGVGLFTLSADEQRLQLRELLQNGQRVDLAGAGAERDWALAAPTVQVLWSRLQQGKYFRETTTEPGRIGHGLLPFLEGEAALAMVYQPLRVRGATIDFVGVSLGIDKEPSKEEVACLQIVAGQAAMALERERWGEGIQQAVLAREREPVAGARKSSLVRDNNAMRGTWERISGTERPETLLEGLLLECVASAGAQSGLIAMWRGGKFLGIGHAVQNGAVLPKQEWSAEALPRGVEKLIGRDPDGYALRILEFGLIREDWQPAQRDGADAAECRAAVGHVEVWSFPCIWNGSLVASLVLCFAESRPERPELLASMEAPALQTALIVELARLEESAQTLAGASVRVAEADRISRFLRSTIGNMPAKADANLAVEAILSGLAQEVGAAHLFLLRFDVETGMLRLELSVVEGRIRRGQCGEELPLLAASFSVDLTPAWRIMTSMRGLFTPKFASASLEEFRWPGCSEYAERFGLSDMGHIVLYSGDVPIGSISLGFREGQTLRVSDKPFIEGVADHVAIALRMVDLAEQARQLAVAREREAAMRETADRTTRVIQTIQSSIDGLNAKRGSRAAILELLKAMAGVLSTLGVVDVLLSIYDPSVNAIRNLEFLHQGQLIPIRGTQFDGDWPVAHLSMARPWMRIQLEEFLWGSISDATLLVPEVREYHEKQGAHSIAHWPIRRRGQTSGFVCISLQSKEAPSSEQIELTKILASSLSLAVEMERLADQEKTVAIAEEREQVANARTAEARRVSEFMSHTLSRMSAALDPQVTVESILSELAEELGAGLVHLFRHDAGKRSMRLEVSCIEGRIRRGPCGEEIELYAAPFADDITPAWELMKKQRGWFSTNSEGEWLENAAWPGVREYVRRSRLSDMGYIVLFAGDLPIGLIVCVLFDGRKIQSGDKAFIEGVAKQAALAIRMAELAEQAKQAAVAMERQRAVEAQAAALAKANDSLCRVNERMARSSDLSAFVPHVLQELCGQTHAPLGLVFELDSSGSRLRLVASTLAGEFMNGPPVFPWRAEGVEIRADDEYWNALCSTRSVVRFEAGGSVAPRRGQFAEWLQERGIQTTLNFPMIVDERVIGFVGVGFFTDPNLDLVQVELAGSLAQQVALGIRLTRLAEEANRSSILEERNRIAREIHDTLAQSFTGILMQLQAAQGYSQKNPTLANECVQRAESLARDGLREARQSVGALSPSEVASEGLVSALERLAEECTTGTAAPCLVSVIGAHRPIPSQLASNILLVCREALSNAQRYAEATRIDVEVILSGDQLRMRIADNGRGFEYASVADAGFGLAGMRGRMERFGGAFRVVTAPGEGTQILLQVALRSPRDPLAAGARQ